MKFFISFFLLAFSFTARSQVVIRPGDDIIRYDQIKTSRSFYKCLVLDSAGTVTYEFVNDQAVTVDSNRRQIIFSRSRQVPLGSFMVDTSVTDLFFKPVSMHEVWLQRNVDVSMSFSDTSAWVNISKAGKPKTTSYPMNKGYFEDNMTEYILGFLQLRKGVTYMLDNFNKDTKAPSDPFQLEYVYDDTWDQSGNRMFCRVLHFIHGASSGLLWIDKSTGLTVKEVAKYDGGSVSLYRL